MSGDENKVFAGVKDKPPAGPRRNVLLRIAAVFIFIGMAYGLYWWFYDRFYERTTNAYVAGNLVYVESQVPGTVVEINADDTDYVRKGQKLLKLGDTDAAIALEEAKASLAEGVRRVRRLRHTTDLLRASIAIKRAELGKAREEYERRRGLVGERAVSVEELKAAGTRMEAARLSLDMAEREHAASEALAGSGPISEHPYVKLAKEKTVRAYLELRRTSIVAPVGGYVAKRGVQVGQLVAPGKPLMAIAPLGRLWVEANFKEDQLRNIRIGQPVELTSDIYGRNTVFNGKVAGIGAGTGSVFSLIPPQNATGNWIKVVQRAPVRITMLPEQVMENPLLLGLSMRAVVDTRDRSGKTLRRTPVMKTRYSTGVYREQIEGAEDIAREVIEANL